MNLFAIEACSQAPTSGVIQVPSCRRGKGDGDLNEGLDLHVVAAGGGVIDQPAIALTLPIIFQGDPLILHTITSASAAASGRSFDQ